MRSPSPAVAALLVVLALAAPEVGAAFAVLIFPALGPMGAVSLRIACSAGLLLAIARPALRGRSHADWRAIVALGIALAGMNTSFYFALERIPLGIASTIEVLGPLVLSVVMGRGALRWLWAALALSGAVLLAGIGFDRLDPLGIGFAAIASACWALYILAAARTGRTIAGLDGLALALVVSTVVTLPFGIVVAGPAMLRPDLLGVALVVAVLSSALPYAAELIALRRIPESTFGVLMALVPASGAGAGFLVLGQALTPLDLVAIALVIAASAGAARTGGSVDP